MLNSRPQYRHGWDGIPARAERPPDRHCEPHRARTLGAAEILLELACARLGRLSLKMRLILTVLVVLAAGGPLTSLVGSRIASSTDEIWLSGPGVAYPPGGW